MTNNRRRVILTLVSAATIFGASACGSAGTGTNTSAAPPAAMAPSSASMGPDMSGAPTASVTATTGTAADAVIQIKSFAYTGPDSVSAGSKVTVTNLDSQAHTLTADDGSFNAVVEPGASVTFTAPTKPGSYTYHCNYHGSMHGTLTVK
ncbi:hypothetical protein AL755_09765 [Arthrobacter sp. ERGS1:01]|nr:hypothetical protein AL755_09765 [Arthrobacter sp. ERGS1:01]